MDKQKTPQEEREKLRQGEQKQNPTGNLRDGFDRGAGNGNVTDIAGDMGWKGMALLIIVLIVAHVIYQLFFS
ncbi:DUF6366 family protein [Planococcus halocryophilus]|uniref:DUF6366 family protein n=1 Tax=Planococcus halocryophilus TaxID=1215089 RepID=UPI001F0D1227|nr:DUF6366 family protein [Planococcus halocryophilus]MCH4825372.1 DUF6366 family protein [Planococcus halocryophilus]